MSRAIKYHSKVLNVGEGESGAENSSYNSTDQFPPEEGVQQEPIPSQCLCLLIPGSDSPYKCNVSLLKGWIRFFLQHPHSCSSPAPT